MAPTLADAAASSSALETLEGWRRAGADQVLLSRRIFGVRLGPEGAPPLLLVHGFPTASWDWAPVAARLAGTHRVAALDLLGYGFSEKPAGHAYSLLEQADLALAFARGAGLERFHLVAHDMGASVALEVLRRPEAAARVLSLTLLNAGLLLARYRPLLVQRLLRVPALGDALARVLTRGAFGRAMAGTFAPGRRPSEALLDDMWELVARDGGLSGYARLIRYIDERAVHEPAWTEAFRAFRGPAQLVWGLRDPVSGAVGAPFAALRPGTTFTPLAEAGHYPQLEEPARVAEAIAAIAR